MATKTTRTAKATSAARRPPRRRADAGQASAAPASILQAQEFPGLYHEIFNETPELAAPVWARLQDWLSAF